MNLKDALWIAILVAGYLHAIFVLGELPPEVPVHFGFSGEPTRYMAVPLGAFIVLIIATLVLIGLRLLAMTEVASEVGGYLHNVLIGIAMLLVSMNVVMLHYALGAAIEPTRIVWLMVGILLIVISNPMGKLPVNRIAGVRLPETMEDPEIWLRANRFAGWLGTFTGLMLIVMYFLPVDLSPIALLIAVLVFALAVTIYTRRISARRLSR